jgi:ubiquitin carboxyl-terminal hydrolase 4/11/15
MRKHVICLRDESEPVLYDLYAVSNHSGALGGGHYTAYCKNLIDMNWYSFNDSSIRKIDNVEETVISPQAYVLFYRRRGVDICDSPVKFKRMTSMDL